jgi:hypothetical protein
MASGHIGDRWSEPGKLKEEKPGAMPGFLVARLCVGRDCKPHCAARMGAPSLPPGRYFPMHMVGYFEGLDSERGIVWRCSDSFSLGEAPTARQWR